MGWDTLLERATEPVVMLLLWLSLRLAACPTGFWLGAWLLGLLNVLLRPAGDDKGGLELSFDHLKLVSSCMAGRCGIDDA